MIANNEVRFDKKIRAWKESGETLHVQEVKDPVEEASYVVEQIKKQMETGILAEEIAVLFRVHTDARAVVEALIDEKIPFQMREHLPNLYNHFIAKDIMAYFRLAMGQRERKDFLQVMNRPKRYLGRDCLPGRVVSFEEMHKFYCDKEWMQDRIDQFEWDLKMLAKMAPYAAIQYLKKKIGYDEFLREYATTKNMKAADLREVLSEIEEAAKPFQTMEEWFVHVEEYTEALKKKEQQKEQNQEGVRLMTLHASKGLEFHTVFLIEANEGRIPYQKAEKEQNVEEERRLFYVGMTRAKDVLKITYVKIKNGKEISPSRFVEELFEASDLLSVKIDLVKFQGIHPLIEFVGSSIVLVVIFDVFQVRLTVFCLRETVDVHIAFFGLFSVLIERKECDVLSAGCFVDRQDGTLQCLVIVQCQSNCYTFVFIHCFIHVFAHSTFSFFLDMPTLTKTRGKSKKNIRFFLLTMLKNRVE